MRRSQALAQLERLESLMSEVDVLTQSLDRLDRDNVRLSLIEAKEHLAKVQGWLADEIVCLMVDCRIKFVVAEEGNTDVA